MRAKFDIATLRAERADIFCNFSNFCPPPPPPPIRKMDRRRWSHVKVKGHLRLYYFLVIDNVTTANLTGTKLGSEKQRCTWETLKVLCNANACWLLLTYIRVTIANSPTVPYKYASYTFKTFSLIFLTLLSPASKKILLIIFSWDDIISQLQKTKLCALPSPQALAHNCITSFHTIPSYNSFLAGIAGTFLT